MFLLIVGPRYGEVGASGRSPTEDEFDYARSLGKDILVLVYDGPRDRAVEEFLPSAGNLGEGLLRSTLQRGRAGRGVDRPLVASWPSGASEVSPPPRLRTAP